jgi:hypothetical protein
MKYVHAQHGGIRSTTGELVPAEWMPNARPCEIIDLTESEAAAINAVLASQQWSPQTNPSNIDLSPEIWAIAEKYGFARPGERETLKTEIERG